MSTTPAPQLSASEQEFLLGHPEALLILLDYHDAQQDQADSMGADCVGNFLRYTELRELGAAIVRKDPECFSEEARRRFLRDPYPSETARLEKINTDKAYD